MESEERFMSCLRESGPLENTARIKRNDMHRHGFRLHCSGCGAGFLEMLRLLAHRCGDDETVQSKHLKRGRHHGQRKNLRWEV